MKEYPNRSVVVSKRMRYIVFGILIAAAIGLGIWLFSASREAAIGPRTETDTAPRAATSTGTSLGMYAEKNALVTTGQRPGTAVTVEKVLLDQPGYAVVHEEKDGKPGAVIGASAFLEKGEHSDVEVKLGRGTRDGETLVVMIHAEKNSNKTFEESADPPTESVLGGPIMAELVIDINANIYTEVMP